MAANQRAIVTPTLRTKRTRGFRVNREVFIGSESPWANPFQRRTHQTVDILDQFERWFDKSDDLDARWMRRHLTDLVDRHLACDCSGRFCHGEILLKRAERAKLTLASPAEWMHITLPTHPAGDHTAQPSSTSFIVALSGKTPQDVVVNAPRAAAWMTGRSLREISEWTALHGGVMVNTEDVPALARQAAIARHPSSRARPQRLAALGA